MWISSFISKTSSNCDSRIAMTSRRKLVELGDELFATSKGSPRWKINKRNFLT